MEGFELKLNYRKCKKKYIQKPIRCCLEKIDNEGISFTTEEHEVQYESINEIIESSNKPEKPGDNSILVNLLYHFRKSTMCVYNCVRFNRCHE